MVKTHSFDRQFIFDRKFGEQYYEVLWYIEQNGEQYFDERGQTYLEAEPITIIVREPMYGMPKDVLPAYIRQRYGDRFILDYARKIVSGKKENGFEYSYGERIREGRQLEYAIEKLREHRWTRRATITIRRVEDILSNDPPCMTVVDFKLRKDGLRLFAWFRSNDMENAYPINYYGLLWLGWYVANELGVKLVRITTRSESAHIYLWRGR